MLGDTIRAARIRSGISAKELAGRIGVSGSYISQIETNAVDPSLSLLRKLARALGLPVTAFFEESYEEPLLLKREDCQTVSGADSGISLLHISPRSAEQPVKLDAALLVLAPGASSGERCCPGDLCLYLAGGSLEVSLPDAEYSLCRGDSLLIREGVPHIFANREKEAAQLYLTALCELFSGEVRA